MTRLTDEERRGVTRSVYWNAMREVCADLRRGPKWGSWRDARYRTLVRFYGIWRTAYGPRLQEKRELA